MNRPRDIRNLLPAKVLGPLSITLLIAAAVIPAVALAADSAPAAAGAFPSCPTNGYLVKADGGDSTLYAVDIAGGAATPLGRTTGRELNAAAFNPLDNHIYAWDVNAGQLVRVNSDLTTVALGAVFPGQPPILNSNVGEIDNDGQYWLTGEDGPNWYQIDLRPGSPSYLHAVRSGRLTNPPNLTRGQDWAFLSTTGSLYRVMKTATEAHLVRFDRATGGQQDLGALPGMPAGPYGADYADRDGFLYASNNETGDIYRINVANHGAILLSHGPPGASNDGARCNLAPSPVPVTAYRLSKSSNPASGTGVLAGQKVTYTLTVTNTGQTAVHPTVTDDLSSVVDDAVYANDASTSDGSAVTRTGNGLSWSGNLAPGASVTIGYSVTVKADGSQGDHRLTNTVTGDGTPTCEACRTEHPVNEPARSYSVTKSADPASGTAVAGGQKVIYTITVTNTGQAGVRPTVTDDLSKVLDDATDDLDSIASDGGAIVHTPGSLQWSGSLAPGATVTVRYSVTVKPFDSQGDHNLSNSVTGDGPVTCASCTTTHPVSAPTRSYAVTKSADPASGTPVAAGQKVTYTITITNTGQAGVHPTVTDDLSTVVDDATEANDATASDGSAITRAGNKLSWSNELAAGARVTIRYSVTVKPFDSQGDHHLTNTVTGDGPVTCAACSTDNPVREPMRSYTVSKSADPPSGTAVVAGQKVTYTITVTNTGETAVPARIVDELSAVVDDAGYNDDGGDAAVNGTTLSWSGSVPAGKTAVIRYSVTVKPFDKQGDHRLTNTVTGTGPATCTHCDTSNPVAAYSVRKSADPTSGTAVGPGQKVTYTITVANAGTAALHPTVVDDLSTVVDDAAFNGDATASNGGKVTVDGTALSWSQELPAGTTVTIHYSVTVKPYDRQGDHQLGNVVTGDGPSGCPAPAVRDPHAPGFNAACVTANPVAKPVPPPAPVVRAASPADPRLASTGFSPTLFLITAGALLALGGLLVATGRRGRRARRTTKPVQ